MALPQAIQRSVEAADQLVAQMNGEAPSLEDTPHQQQTQEPAPAQPVVEPVPQVTAPAPAPATDPWETKFKVLKGKYDAEVPRLSQQVRELMQANQNMMAQMEEFKTSRAQADVQNLVTDADKEAFGADLIGMTERVAKQQMQAMQRELDVMHRKYDELKSKMERTETSVQGTAEDAYRINLTQMVPNWAEINERQEWLEWLGEVDPVFGTQRQAALDKAYAALDYRATAQIFNAFVRSQTPAEPAKPVKSPKDELQRQVAPSRSRAAVTPQADEWSEKIWTPQEIEQFYNDQRKGVYSLADADRIAAEIDRAVAQGRVRM